MCDYYGWAWGMGTEFINYELKNARNYEVLDLSFVGEFNLKIGIKLLFGGYKMRGDALKYFKSNRVKVINGNFRKIALNKKSLKHAPLEISPTINSIVEKSGTIDLKFIQESKKKLSIVKKEIRKSNLVYTLLHNFNFSEYSKIITVNGRFTKSATVVRFCKENSINYGLLEGGGKSSSFQLFETSPHSTKEIQDKINHLWGEALEPTRSEIARKYFENLIINRQSAEHNYRSHMVVDKTPDFSDKKICVFYASSEWEYFGLYEQVPEGYFRNQTEAFRALLNCLDENIWDVYLRRHPSSHKSSKYDGEKVIWEEFKGKSNIHVIEPNSDTDSLALGYKADLIASFASTINIEFLARELRNVITLGPAPWNHLLPERYLPTEVKIKKFINSSPDEISLQKLLPWAYYQCESGTQFELVATDAKTGVWKINKL
jgi:hypothetical protein